VTAARRKAARPPASRSGARPEKNSTVFGNAEAKPRFRPPAAGIGRVKGNPNKITREVREIFKAFVEGNSERVQELWDRVAKHQPAKALSIYAKLAEFVLPKLQRTELSGHVTGAAVSYPAWSDMSPVQAAQAYQDMMVGRDGEGGKNVTFRDPEHSEGWYRERDAQRAHEREMARLAAPVPPPPRQQVLRPAGLPVDERVPLRLTRREERGIAEAEVAELPAPPDAARARDEALDSVLRHQRAPRVDT
jgi:hypothetical protein